MIAHPGARDQQYPVDKAEIVALVESVLAWDLSSRDRKEPPPETVESAIRQLSQHVVMLSRGLSAHVRALPADDDIGRRATVTLGEAHRRLHAATQSQATALRAQNLARLVQSLNNVSDAAEARVRGHRPATRGTSRTAPPAPERGWP